MQRSDAPLEARTIPALARAAAARFGEGVAVEDGAVTVVVRGSLAAPPCARRAPSWPPASRPATASRSGRPTSTSGSWPRSGSRAPAACWSPSTRAGRARRRATSYGSVGPVCSARWASSWDRIIPRCSRARISRRSRRMVCLRGEAAGTLAWRDFLARGDAVPEAQALARADAVSPDALSDLLFTSGTTGRPKGVMTSHAQNLRAFAAWSEVVGLREGDRYLVVNPVLPRLRLQGGLAGVVCCAAPRCCPTRSSTCPPCSSAWARRGSRCCRARRPCISRSSRTRIAPASTSRRCGWR